jgi:hypothetical protein
MAGHQHGNSGDPAEERGEDGADGCVREPAASEGDADQDGAEAVGNGSCTLGRDDATCVRAQARSS